MVKISQLDALEYLESIPDESVGVIVTDPPYWTLDRWRKVGTTTRLGGHRDKDKRREEMFFETIDMDYLWSVFLEFDRVLKLDGHLYIFCDDRVGAILLNWIHEAQGDHRFGDAHALDWDKVHIGMGYHYRRRYELIIFAWREPREGVRGFKKRKLANLGVPDVLTAKRVKQSDTTYPTEKPVEIIETLLQQSARNGDTILDPFAGSGSLAVAAPRDMNLDILLNDKSPQSVEWIKRRLGSSLFAEVPCENETSD